jgi:hypothetical protein
MAPQNKKHRDQKLPRPGSERHRDESRVDPGPAYAGGDWELADERVARRLAPEQVRVEDEPAPEVESGGERAGMERGRLPRKDRGREPG